MQVPASPPKAVPTRCHLVVCADLCAAPSASNLLLLQRLVDRLRWMSDEVYGELFALGQCMPGPTSTQVSFAIGVIKKGVSGE